MGALPKVEYESYKEKIIDSFERDFKLEKRFAEQFLKEVRFEDSFAQDRGVFCHLEPGWVAKSLFETHLK